MQQAENETDAEQPVLLPFVYNFVAPKFIGVPFFIWYQLLAVVFGAVVAGVVYRLREG